MYFLLVRDWGASRPGTYAFISPVIAMAIGSTLFGEKLDWGDGVGMTLMLLAAALALRPAAASGGRSAGDATRFVKAAQPAEADQQAVETLSATAGPPTDARGTADLTQPSGSPLPSASPQPAGVEAR